MKIRLRYDPYFGRWIAWGGNLGGVCYGPFGVDSLGDWLTHCQKAD